MDHDSYPQDHRPRQAETFRGFPIISDQISPEGLGVVWRELEKVLQTGASGNVVEFGCYIGTTSLFIRRLLDKYDQSDAREFHVYDSFEGLPPKTAEDESAAGVDFQAGKLFAGKRELLQQFKNVNLRPPIVHKGWFDQLSGADVPEHIAFAFLDGDFYGSIMSSLQLVWPKLEQGSVVVIDDYQRAELPGVDRAVHEFLRGKTYKRLRGQANKAIIEL